MDNFILIGGKGNHKVFTTEDYYGRYSNFFNWVIDHCEELPIGKFYDFPPMFFILIKPKHPQDTLHLPEKVMKDYIESDYITAPAPFDYPAGHILSTNEL